MHKIVYLAVKKVNILVNIISSPFLIAINFDKETEKNKEEDPIYQTGTKAIQIPWEIKRLAQ